LIYDQNLHDAKKAKGAAEQAENDASFNAHYVAPFKNLGRKDKERH